MWTRFMDMHSGGGCKERPYEKIYIEAEKDEAIKIFYNRFGHNPERVTCTCCGEDYSISESPSLEEASGFDRNCESGYVDENGNEVPSHVAWVPMKGTKEGCRHTYFDRPNKEYTWAEYMTLPEYMKQEDVLIIRADEIKTTERTGRVPKQGYVWVE